MSDGYTSVPNWRDTVENRLGGLTGGQRAMETAQADLRRDVDAVAAKVDTLGVNLTNKIDTTFGAMRADFYASQQPARSAFTLDWKLVFLAGALVAGLLVGAGYSIGAGGHGSAAKAALEMAP